MPKKWINRQFITYIPLFLALASGLLMIFFLSISQMSKNGAMQAGDAYLRQIIQVVDSSLDSVDQLMIKEIFTDLNIRLFIERPGQVNMVLVDYAISQKIRDLTSINPLIDSVYFYRINDQVVLSKNQKVALQEFGDRDFIQNLLGEPKSWTGRRVYKEFKNQSESVPVVSLVRSIMSADGGLIVINVKLETLKQYIRSTMKSQVTDVNVFDQNHSVMVGAVSGKEKGAELTQLKSDYTGWTYQSVLKNGQWLGLIGYLWGLAALGFVGLGTIILIMMIRRNYQPIETLIARIHPYADPNNSRKKEAFAEFKVIEIALDQFEKQSSDYMKKHEEDLVFRRRHFFRELMEGNRQLTPNEWQLEMERLGLPEEFEQFSAVVIEIDKFSEFTESYTTNDQYLLKYVVGQVVEEVSRDKTYVWTEWMSKQQLGVLFQFSAKETQIQETLADLGEQLRAWVEYNLKFTVTIGIGTSVQQALLIYESYREAVQAIRFKTAYGGNRIISYNEVWMKPQGEILRNLQLIRSMAQLFRVGHKTWKHPFTQFMDELKKGFFPRNDIISQTNYMIFHLYREIMELPVEFHELWKTTTVPKLNEIISRFDSIEDIERDFLHVLEETAEGMSRIRESRNNRNLLAKMKTIIEHSYADQDLSLDQLAAKFSLSPRYLSHLFKDEFGVKFVDYLVDVRMEKAKQLLKEKNVSIQEIALQVGYHHAGSFIRIFKKVVGITPGDYRKETSI